MALKSREHARTSDRAQKIRPFCVPCPWQAKPAKAIKMSGGELGGKNACLKVNM